MERVRLIQTRVKFTKAFLDSVPFESSGQRLYRDTELKYFGLCVGKTTKTFFVEATVSGKNQTPRMKIGRYGDGQWTLEEARREAMALLSKTSHGINPLEERQKLQAEQEERKAREITLSQLWDIFRQNKRLKAGTLDEYKKYLQMVFFGERNEKNNFSYPNWSDRPITGITRDEVRTLHRQIGIDRGKPAYANGAFRTLSSVLELARARRMIAENPVSVLRDEKLWFPDTRRQSVIRPHQLSAWFRGINEVRSRSNPPSAAVGCDYLEFVLFTGLRREEAATLQWADVDFEDRIVTIPGSRTKNSKTHILPLTDHILEILKRRQKATPESLWVFASTSRIIKGKGNLAEPRFIADLVAEVSGVKFTIHDLRRTFLTTADSLDFSHYAMKRLVNHSANGDVTAGYIISDVERLREPMQKITNFFVSKMNFPANNQLKVA